MGKITLGQAAQWCGGHIDPKYKDVVFFGASNDTRKLQQGQLFVALQGARDGHEFIPAALEKGASAVLCTHCSGDFPAIIVEDTRLALGDIARHERQRIGMKVIGVTGSVGNSTTKEMIACVLKSQYRVSKTPVNHNNDIGMPMAILAMPEDTQIAVLEMGMNHFQEIAYLTGIANPDMAVIVNIGTMHMEHLGSMEGILQAKLEILEGLKQDGTVILNGDDSLLWGLRSRSDVNGVYFGVQNPECQVKGTMLLETADSLQFRVEWEKGTFAVTLALSGKHYVSDALAAISVGLMFEIPPESICKNLESFENIEGRQEILRTEQYTIIKDCYNAGPESMAAALVVLEKQPGRRIAVLGDMLELGVCTTGEHYKVGRIAAEKADLLFAYGPNSKRVIHGALTGGMATTAMMAFEDQEALAAALKRHVKAGDVLLFKGSHGMHMERVLDMFLRNED